MAEAPPAEATAARVATFATLGALQQAQELVRAVLPALGEGADAALVAEETLALVATATARAAEVGLRGAPAVAMAVGTALAELPFLYHDWLLGAEMIARGAEGDVPVDTAVYDRLERKSAFYTAHLPPGRFPGPLALRDAMALWMGRISPPKLPTSPIDRLAALGLTDGLGVHLRLVLAFAQRAAGGE